MRILNGYSKDQQKELEYTKNVMSCNNLLNNITYFQAYTECGSIKDKYDKANKEEQISIIRDILDFYTDKAKFAEPKKCYVHFVKGYKNGYLNMHKYTGEIFISTRKGIDNDVFKTAFTDEEIKAIDPRYMAFAVPVEVDDE